MKRVEQKTADKNIFGSLFKTAVMIYGFYQLLNLSIFKGNDFRREDLSEEQIKAMDVHNKNHHMADLVDSLGNGLGAGFSIVNPGVSEEIEVNRITHLAEKNEALDSDVAKLPPPLNHKHTA